MEKLLIFEFLDHRLKGLRIVPGYYNPDNDWLDDFAAGNITIRDLPEYDPFWGQPHPNDIKRLRMMYSICTPNVPFYKSDTIGIYYGGTHFYKQTYISPNLELNIFGFFPILNRESMRDIINEWALPKLNSEKIIYL